MERGAPVGSIWAEFQLKGSHSDPFHAQYHCFRGTGHESAAPGCSEMSPSGFWDCFRITQHVLRLKSSFCFQQSHGDFMFMFWFMIRFLWFVVSVVLFMFHLFDLGLFGTGRGLNGARRARRIHLG